MCERRKSWSAVASGPAERCVIGGRKKCMLARGACRSAAVARARISFGLSTMNRVQHLRERGCDRTADGQPGTKCCRRCLPERQRPFEATFTPNADTHGLRCDVLDPQACQLRDAETSAYGEVQHSPIPDSRPRGWIWSVEQSLHFFLDQMGYQPSNCLLEGDRQNAANLLDGSRFTVLEKAQERADGSQADASRLR
jgi:hypothetical protein